MWFVLECFYVIVEIKFIFFIDWKFDYLEKKKEDKERGISCDSYYLIEVVVYWGKKIKKLNFKIKKKILFED